MIVIFYSKNVEGTLRPLRDSVEGWEEAFKLVKHIEEQGFSVTCLMKDKYSKGDGKDED